MKYEHSVYEYGSRSGSQKHITRIWCEMYNVDYDGDQLDLVLTEDNEQWARTIIGDKKVIVIAPFAANYLTVGKTTSNKDWTIDRWEKLIKSLQNYFVIQVGRSGEYPLGADQVIFDRSLKDIAALLKHCYSFVAVESIIPHLAHAVGKHGVVLFSRGNPKIFGHKENFNLKKSCPYARKCLGGSRPQNDWQHDVWECPDRPCIKNIKVKEVIEKIHAEKVHN